MAASTTPTAYRAALSRCIDCAERQIGLRAVRDALALAGRNPEREAELLGRLPHLLAVAQERTRRERARARLPAGWRASASPDHFAAVAARMSGEG